MKMRTKEGWEELVELAKVDERAMTELGTACFSLIRGYIIKHEFKPQDEWFFALTPAIPRAIERFKPGNAAFPVYLYKCCNWLVGNVKYRLAAQKRGGFHTIATDEHGNETRERHAPVQIELDEEHVGAMEHSHCALEDVRWLMKCLTRKQAIAIELRYYWDLSPVQIARICGCSPQMVYIRLNSACERMSRYEENELSGYRFRGRGAT